MKGMTHPHRLADQAVYGVGKAPRNNRSYLPMHAAHGCSGRGVGTAVSTHENKHVPRPLDSKRLGIAPGHHEGVSPSPTAIIVSNPFSAGLPLTPSMHPMPPSPTGSYT